MFTVKAVCAIVIFLHVGFVTTSLPPSSSSKFVKNCKPAWPGSIRNPCFCDYACQFYDDCCHRFYKQLRFFRCLDVTKLRVDTVGGPTRFFVFDRCPSGTNEELRQRCERPVEPSEGLDRSVVIASNDSRLFRNVYCALCHGASFEEPKLKLVCNRKLSINTTSDSRKISAKNIDEVTPDCEVKNRIASYRYRSCDEIQNIVSDCPKKKLPISTSENSSRPFNVHNESMTWREVKDRCSTKPTYFVRCVNDSRTYRNMYCASCHQSSGECIESEMSINFAYGGRGRSGFLFAAAPMPYSYSIITDFRRLAEVNSQKELPDVVKNISVADNDTFGNSSLFSNATESPPSQRSLVASYLTLTCCLLSALGLVLLIAVFAAVPSLRNFGGVLTLSLASTLLVGLLCFLVGPNITQYGAACHIVGVVMYFAYLSSFAWMSLFAVDVLKTFVTSAGAGSAVRGSSIFKRYAKFAVGGWLLPLIVTLAAVMVDQVWPHSSVSARFGRGQCYFNSGYALLAWFFVPVAVAVVANVVISVVVITSVRRTTQQTKQARGNSMNKQVIFLTIKITAIFGLTWIFGLISAFVDNFYFDEIAGIVNSLQGAFVSLSFLLSSRTIREMRSLSSSFSNASASSSTKYTAVKSQSRNSERA